MIKAVATALVLIAGAAVVLWFGNTLNSWVLGGLIGGLAALLLSIPISLTLFSYLSRRHDEQLRAEAELTEADLEMYEYEELPARTARGGYAIEAYQEEEEAFWEEEEEPYYQQPRQQMRSLPQPTPQRYLEQNSASNRQSASRRGAYGPLPKPGTRNMPAARGKDVGSRRPTTRNMNYPGMPGYATGATLSQQKAEALRAARREKKQQQYEDDVEVLPTHLSRRLPAMGSEQDMTGQYEQLPRPRSSQRLVSETPQPQRRSRVVEAKPSRHDIPRSLPPAGGSSFPQPAYLDDPETDNLSDFNPETGSIRRPTGQFARNPRLDTTHLQTENPSSTLGRPLVRRAPYMYEDDPIRQEFSQQIYPPTVRRSSRLQPQQGEQE